MTMALFWGTKDKSKAPGDGRPSIKNSLSFASTMVVEPYKGNTVQVTPLDANEDEDGLKDGVAFNSVTDYDANDSDPSSPGLASAK